MIILDTNVISEPLRPDPNHDVTRWLDAQSIQTLHLTTITLAEVRYGIAALPDGRRKEILQGRFEGEVVPLFSGRLLPFDDAASTSYASLRARARHAGRAIGDFDALIAAIAATHGFAVATRDTSPFSAAGVATINPFTEPPSTTEFN